MNYLIIGYGNTLRSDDGAGYYIAEQVAEWGLEGVRSLFLHQLTPELADTIAQSDAVIFVDAAPPQSLSLDTIALTPVKIDSAKSTLNLGHGLSPSMLLAMAQSLYGVRPEAYLVLVPTENFDFGEQVSSLTQKSMTIVLDLIRKYLG